VRAVLLLALVMLAACMRPPRPIAGDFPPVQVTDVQGGAHVGERVRWGGIIVETRPEQDQTCFQIVSLPLDARARRASSTGRTAASRRARRDSPIRRSTRRDAR
jgi:outer membrane lipoprotein